MSGKRRAGEPGSRTLRLSHTMVLSERSTDELDPRVDIGAARPRVYINYKQKLAKSGSCAARSLENRGGNDPVPRPALRSASGELEAGG